jgi:hypothetical protein
MDNSKDFGDIDVVPGQTVEAYLFFENLNNDRRDETQDIEDIAAELTIEDLGEEDDIEEIFDDFTLRATRDEDLPFSFTVPYRIEEKNYLIDVKYEFTEDGTEYEKTEDFYIRVKKEDHELFFNKLSFEPSELMCNEVSYLNIEIYNIGTNDEDITLKIANKELDISLQRGIELEKYPGDDIHREKIPIKVPLDTPTGIYPVEITVSYGNLADVKVLNLDVSCGDEMEVKINGKEEPEKETVKSPQVSDLDAPKVVVKQENNTFLIIITVLLVLIIIAIIVVSSLKKR